MSSATLPQNPLLPQSPGGNAPGAALAVLVHAGLVAVLALGIDWRNREPDAVSAELWAAVPQVAAPPPVAEVSPPSPPLPVPVLKTEPVPPAITPTPAPAPKPAPDIAIEQDRKRKAETERKRVEQEAEVERKKREKLEKLEAQKQADKLAQEKANDERLAQQHKDNVRRLMGQAGATPGQTANSGIAARSAAPSASYAGKVNARVRQYIVFPGSVANDAVAEVEVNSAPGGSILSRRLIKSSGNKEWDEAVLRAIDKTSSLPPDTDGRVPARLIIAFKWNE